MECVFAQKMKIWKNRFYKFSYPFTKALCDNEIYDIFGACECYGAFIA